MTCHDCELLMGDGNFGADVATHLRTCPACQLVADELRENSLAFAAMRQEEWVEQASACYGGFSRHSPRIWTAAAAAAVLALALASVWHPSPAPQELVFTPPQPPVPPVTVVPPARPRPPKPRTAPSQEEQLLVKMLTPDPDVVVYWIVEPKEKTE